MQVKTRECLALFSGRRADIYMETGLVPMEDALFFRNRQEWRTWLEKNHIILDMINHGELERIGGADYEKDWGKEAAIF